MLTNWQNEECLECGHAHTLFTGQRERERERGREREKERDVEYGHWIYFNAFNNGSFTNYKSKCFSNSLKRNKIYNCPELRDTLVPFSSLVSKVFIQSFFKHNFFSWVYVVIHQRVVVNWMALLPGLATYIKLLISAL